MRAAWQIAWHDTQDTGDLVTTLNNNMITVQAAMGERLLTALQMVGQAISGIVIAFAYGWKLTLVILALLPVFFGFTIVSLAKATRKYAGEQATLYAKANTIATEAFMLIKTVMAANTQQMCVTAWRGFFLRRRETRPT